MDRSSTDWKSQLSAGTQARPHLPMRNEIPEDPKLLTPVQHLARERERIQAKRLNNPEQHPQESKTKTRTFGLSHIGAIRLIKALRNER